MNCRDIDGRHSTPLHFAAGYNRRTVVEYLLKQGAHKVEIKWINPNPDFRIYHKSYITYGDTPAQPLNPIASTNSGK